MKNSLYKVIEVVYFVFGFLISSNGQINIPEKQKIDWTPGIPEGIPIITGPIVNVIDYGADSTGANDSYAAFTKAMNSLTETGGVIFIPSGSYKLDSALHITKNNLVFRGKDTCIPRIFSYYPGNSILVGVSQSGQWQNLVSGYQKNSNSVIVEDASVFKHYKYVEIQEDNDSTIMYTRPVFKQDWAENSVGQIFEIDSIEGNRIVFISPIHIDFYAKRNPMIRSVSMVENVGFENIYVEKMAPNDHTFNFEYTAHCWLKGVESYHTRRTHVCLTACLENEVRESFFHKSFHYGDGGSGYGVECRVHTTNVLVENNVFDSLRHAMLVQVGANGNVYAYNYSLHPLQGAGETDLNVGWIPPDISIHGHYPYMNLFEGNFVSEIGISDYWGPVGPGNTYFRNMVYGDGIILYDHSNGQNIIGNNTTVLNDTDSTITDVFEFENIIGQKTVQEVSQNKIILPASLYLKKVPDYFKGFQWPPFGSYTQDENTLPAQAWYENQLKK